MTLTINISSEAEVWLKARAAAAGRDTAEYAAEIVEQSVRPDTPASTTSAEQARLSALAEELIRRSEQLEFDSNPPRLRGQEAEIEELIAQKFRKQGLQL